MLRGKKVWYSSRISHAGWIPQIKLEKSATTYLLKPFPNGCQTPRKGKPVIRFVVVCRHSSLCIYNPIQSQPSTINLYCLVCGSPLLCSGDNHIPKKKKMLGGGGFVCSEFYLQCLRMCTFVGLLSSVMRFFIDLLFILFGSDVVRFAVNHDHFFFESSFVPLCFRFIFFFWSFCWS